MIFPKFAMYTTPMTLMSKCVGYHSNKSYLPSLTPSSLVHGVCGDPADFCVSTRGAGAGGLALAVEGPSKAEIGCQDNKDGTVNVSYLPTAPGEYKVKGKRIRGHT